MIEAKSKVRIWIEHYNNNRLHSSLNYMLLAVWHKGDPKALYKERQRKIEDARKERRLMNLKQAS